MKGPGRVEMTQEHMEELVSKIEHNNLSETDRKLLVDLVYAVRWMNQTLEEKRLSIRRLQAIFGIRTEKASHLLKTIEKALDQEGAPVQGQTSALEPQAAEKAKGHGRLSAEDYVSAKTIAYSHPTLKAGLRCPGCERGNLCSLPSGKLLRITAFPPLQATLHRAERLRCATCGELYAAEVPPDIGPEKFDGSACSMVSLLRYGYGFPMNRLAHFQNALGVPLPAGTQWEMIIRVVEAIRALFQHLVFIAAQGQIFYNDDTSIKILELMEPKESAQEQEKDPERTGMFTTGIVAQVETRQIRLFFSGRDHAGENLAKLLAHRDPARGIPLQMCDALSRNEPPDGKTEVANCLTHGRRKFYEVYSIFPEPVKFVIGVLRNVYRNEAISKQQQMSPEERLRFHQRESAPVLDALKGWMDEQLDKKKVEPNSSLGKAIQYMQNHWAKLTCFLRVAGAPLTNDECERLLKTAIRHRNNSLFYKTELGAEAGDILMSVIQTATAAGVNPFDYLNALQKYKAAVAENPDWWLPWNYEATMKSLSAPPVGSTPSSTSPPVTTSPNRADP